VEIIYAWEQRKLGEVADVIGGGTPDTAIKEYWGGYIDWYSPFKIGEQLFATGSQKKITALGLQKSSAKILPVGTVLFTSRAGIGNTAILAKEGTTNQGFQSIVPFTNVLDTYFLYSRTRELKRYGEIIGAGSTFIEVSGKQMSNMPIFIPSFSEQISIGNFFHTLDNTIVLYKRKLDSLKQLKKAYLQQMFPQEGETVPKIRFAGFKGDWEMRKLGDVAKISTGNKDTQDAVEDGEFNFFVRSPKVEKINSYSFDGEAVLTAGDGVGVGKVFHYVNGKFDYHQRVYMISDFKGCDGFFFYQYFSSNFIYEAKKYNAKTSVDSVRREMITMMDIPCPSLPEQTVIGNFFRNLGEQIATQQAKLDNLKKLKSSYLQKMFV